MRETAFDMGVLAGADLGVVTLADGGVIYAKGDDGDQAYIVRRGSVELRCLDHSVEVVGPGEILGIAAVLDGGPRFSTAVARGGTELIPLSRSIVEALLSDDPEFASAVTALMVRRLRAAFAGLDRTYADIQAEPSVTPSLSPVSI